MNKKHRIYLNSSLINNTSGTNRSFFLYREETPFHLPFEKHIFNQFEFPHKKLMVSEKKILPHFHGATLLSSTYLARLTQYFLPYCSAHGSILYFDFFPLMPNSCFIFFDVIK